MELHQVLVQGAVQQMILTPKMQQAIEILQLCSLELERYIEQQLTENVMLEEETSESEEADSPSEDEQDQIDEPPQTTEENPQSETPEGSEADRNLDAELENLMASYSDYYYEGRDFSVSSGDGKRGFIENTAAEAESMTKSLLRQLSLSTDNETDFKIGEWIISEIDERGYFSSSAEEGSEKLGVDAEEVDRVLRIIQGLTPVGIGARDLRECLLIQIEASHKDNLPLRKIVEDHLEQLAKKQYPKIAQALKISVQEVQDLGSVISSLEPIPGRFYGDHGVIYIQPDVVVKKVDNEYVVYINDDGLPKLRISPFYRKLLKEYKDNPKTKEYIRDKLRSAQWLVKNIQQRKETILRVAQNIVDVQKNFFERGVTHLKPLTLKEIAERIGMHESTISRVTTNKYMETPRGIFELKYFFSSGIENAYGETASSTSVKDMIRTLIDNEDKHKPLSDQKITELLNRRGLNIARRTAAKYREELGVLSSKYRREY